MRIKQIRHLKWPKGVNMDVRAVVERINDLPAAARTVSDLQKKAAELHGQTLRDLEREIGRVDEPNKDLVISSIDAYLSLFYSEVQKLGPAAQSYVKPPEESQPMRLIAYQDERESPGASTWRAARRRYEQLFRLRDTLREITSSESGPWRVSFWLERDSEDRITINDVDGIN